MRVTAEGAESQAQVTVLRNLGCDIVQGFVYGRPAPPTTALVQAKTLELQSERVATRRPAVSGVSKVA